MISFLKVHTARLGTRAAKDPDAFVVMRDGPPNGHPFAPSWELLQPVLDARHVSRAGFAGADEAMREDLRERAREIEHAAWRAYVPGFMAEMRKSYRRDRLAWIELLGRERVVLLCSCQSPERCHRTILARVILPALGAKYVGELASHRKSIDIEQIEIAT